MINVELKPCPFCGGEAETHDEVVVDPILDPKTGAYVGADVVYSEHTGCPKCDIWFELAEDEPEGTTIEKWNGRAQAMGKLKPCPFCGGKAHMECTSRYRGSGGFRSLVLFVDHDPSCIIRGEHEIIYGHIGFDHTSDVGRSVLDGMMEEFAERWNRRA